MDLDLEPLIQNDIDDNWIKENSKRLSEKISSKEITLVQLVEYLGPVLTHAKHQMRCGGLNLLTSTLELLPHLFLQNDEVSLLVNFYTDRLRDHHSAIPASLRGLSFLSECVNLNKSNVEVLLDRTFRELMVQQQVVRDRSVVFNMLAYLLYNRFDFVKQVETQFLVGFLQAAEGEKDPRNLALIFQCTAYILQTLNIEHLKEDIFESLAVYFPIDFTPPKGVSAIVTKDDLILGLRSGISHPSLAEFSVPLFMEKLDSDLESAKEDSVDSLRQLIKNCNTTQGSKAIWLAENAKLLELVWSGLKTELLGIRLRASESVHIKIFKLFTELSCYLGEEGKGLTVPGEDQGWSLWMSWLVKDLTPHVQAVGTKLLYVSIQILSAVAASGKTQSSDVFAKFLPGLLSAWSKAGPEPKKQLLASINSLLVAVAHTGLVIDSDNTEFDELVTVYLDSGELQGLAQAAGLLSSKHRKELCCHLISSVQKGEDQGPAILSLASWDEELVEKEILPKLISSGDPGLNALSHLQIGRLLAIFLLPVSVNLDQYSKPVLANFFKNLSNLDPTSDDRDVLSSKVGEIINNFLGWKSRPTLTESSEPLRLDFCKALEILGSLTDNETLAQVDLQHRLNQPLSQGECLEVEAIISSLDLNCLIQNQDIIKQVFGTPGLWGAKASIVNKLPDLSEDLTGVDDVEGISQIAHALALAGDARATHWIQKMLALLDDPLQGVIIAKEFDCLCKPATWQHSVSSFLFRQRVWSSVYPVLSIEASKPGKIYHLSALLSILPQVPKPLLEPKLASLLPLLVRGLKLEDATESALISLNNILLTNPTLISSHIREIVEGCLSLTKKPNKLAIRLKALVCLKYIGQLSNPDTVALSQTVTESLGHVLQDHKRVVREAGAKARNRWYLVTQP